MNTTKAAGLRNMQLLATGLLILMAVVFVVAKVMEARHPGVGYVRAFAEAAMIGALADWFAVVALFRHPLGLPIPHTAIISRNKERIGNTLAAFVVENFLSREVVGRRLANLDFMTSAAGWLGANKRTISWKVVQFIPRVLDALDDEDVKRFVHAQLVAAFKSIQLAPLAGNLLTILTADNKHQELLNEALGIAGTMVDENRDLLRQKVREEVPLLDWPGISKIRDLLADYVANKVVAKVHATLSEAANDPSHRLRQQFEVKLQRFIEELKTSPTFHAKGEELKEKLLQHAALAEYVGEVWTALKQRINTDRSVRIPRFASS